MTLARVQVVQHLPPAADRLSLTAIRFDFGDSRSESYFFEDNPTAATLQPGDWVSVFTVNATRHESIATLKHLPYLPVTESLAMPRLENDDTMHAITRFVQENGPRDESAASELGFVFESLQKVRAKFHTDRLPTVVILQRMPGLVADELVAKGRLRREDYEIGLA